MMTVSQLLEEEGKLWSATPSKILSEQDELLWILSEELSSVLEMILQPNELHEVTPLSVYGLRMAEERFEKIGALPSQSMAVLLLRHSRACAGLTDE